MNKYIKNIVTICGTAFCLVACSNSEMESADIYDSDKQQIMVDADQELLTFSAEAQQVELCFQSNIYWCVQPNIIHVDDELSGDWFTITPGNNFGKRPVTLTLDRNLEKYDRKVELVFTADGESDFSRTLTVVQKASSPVIEVSGLDKMDGLALVDTKIDFKLTTSENWNIVLPEWCELYSQDAPTEAIMSGAKMQDGLMSLLVSFNKTNDVRAGVIRFVSKDNASVVQEFTISQEGEVGVPKVTLTDDALNFSLAWDKIIGSNQYRINIYKSGTDELVKTLTVPADDEQNYIFDLQSIAWGTPVTGFLMDIDVEAVVNEEITSHSKRLVGLHNLFDVTSGDGSVDSPYIISLPRHFLAVSQILSGNYLQTEDLDMSGISEYTPIASNEKKPFTGVYDGGGKKISNLTWKPDNSKKAVGLWGYVKGEGAEIAHVIVEKMTMETVGFSSTGTTKCGGLVGYLSDDAKIENCVMDGFTFTNSWKNSKNTNMYVGGLVGESVFGIITSCKNMNGTFKLSNACVYGGIAGSITGAFNPGQGLDDFLVVDCENRSEVVDTHSDAKCAGIVGVMVTAGVKGCTNYASLEICAATGGIVATRTNSAKVLQCANYGTISGKARKGNSCIGGIAGEMQNGTGPVNDRIVECFNAGKIENSESTVMCYVGGIVGGFRGQLIDCYNTGELSLTACSDKAYVGGLIGLNSCNKANHVPGATHCYNIGSIVSGIPANLGGIMGFRDLVGGFTLENNFFLDTVSAVVSNDPSAAGAVAKSDSELRFQNTFQDWDFDTVWSMEGGYPVLKNNLPISE